MELASAAGLQPSWELEAAALLSQVGYVSLPIELVEKAVNWEPLNTDEVLLLAEVPKVTRGLLAHLASLQGMTDSGPQLREIRLREVVPGMILMDDLRTELGTLLVTRDHEISHSFIDRMGNSEPVLLEERLRVRLKRS